MQIAKLLAKSDLPGGARLTTAQIVTADGSYQASSVFHGGWPAGLKNTTWTSEAEATAGHADMVFRAQHP